VGNVNRILRFFTNNFNFKVISIISAVIIWAFIHHTISETKPLSGVPIKIINLPSNKTIEELSSNGYLNRRAALTISGTKKVVDSIEPGDIEIRLDASNQPNDWFVHITKKDIYSLNPNFDLQQSLESVSTEDFPIKITRMIQEEIPITVEDPKGPLPKNYQFLGVWPRQLIQTVSGPEDAVNRLLVEGLEINIDLNNISKSELTELTNPTKGKFGQDVVFFNVPEEWKKVYIPFENPSWQPINDPNARDLWIEFLRKHMIPLKQHLPIRVYYPLSTAESINPDNTDLETNGLIETINGIDYLNLNLMAYEVSQLFVETVKNNIEIAIIADDQSDKLHWSLEFMETAALEDQYVSYLSNQYKENSPNQRFANGDTEERWRNRFRRYMQDITLFKPNKNRLRLHITRKNGKIVVEEDAS